MGAIAGAQERVKPNGADIDTKKRIHLLSLRKENGRPWSAGYDGRREFAALACGLCSRITVADWKKIARVLLPLFFTFLRRAF